MRIGIAALVLAVAGLAGCSTTGSSFNSSGLNHIIQGQTTMEQASEYLGAMPVDTWRRNDGSVLARWAYKGTVATDALYFRQEAWLLFGADGTFERTENSINIPMTSHTRTRAQAQREADERAINEAAAAQARAEAAARAEAKAQAAAQTEAAKSVSDQASGVEAAQTLPVQPQTEPSVTTGNALLPAGTTYTPGVSYPIPQQK